MSFPRACTLPSERPIRSSAGRTDLRRRRLSRPLPLLQTYNKLEQLGVSATAGYIAGVFCAVVSHPADTMVSKLNAPIKPGQAKPSVGSIYSEIGFGGLWAGLGTRIFMIGQSQSPDRRGTAATAQAEEADNNLPPPAPQVPSPRSSGSSTTLSRCTWAFPPLVRPSRRRRERREAVVPPLLPAIQPPCVHLCMAAHSLRRKAGHCNREFG